MDGEHIEHLIHYYKYYTLIDLAMCVCEIYQT